MEIITIETSQLKKIISESVMQGVNSALHLNQLAVIANKEAANEMPIDIAEASSIIKRRVGTIYNLCYRGKIPYNKQRGKILFFKSELLKWLKQKHNKESSNG